MRYRDHARFPAWIAGVIWLAIVGVMFAVASYAQSRWTVQRYADIMDTPDLAGWISLSESVDTRGFPVRLLLSIRPWGEAGKSQGKVRVDADGANVSGSIHDNERFSRIDWTPEAFALGINGGADF